MTRSSGSEDIVRAAPGTGRDAQAADGPASDLGHVRAFLAEHRTLVLATVADGQPWCTRVFFAEGFEVGSGGVGGGAEDTPLPTLYLLAKMPSRKLTNLGANDRVGVFVGPEQPTAWLEARGHAAILADDVAADARARVLAKAPEAGPFLARVTAVAVRIRLGWLRLTDVRVEPRRVVELGRA